MNTLLRTLRGVIGLGFLAWLLTGPAPARAVPDPTAGRSRLDVPSTAAPPHSAAFVDPSQAAAADRPRPAAEDPARPAAERADAGAGVRVLQLVIGALGVGLLAWGGWLLLGLGAGQWVSVGLWLAGGVIAHDALLAPVVVVLGVLAVRVVPAAARAPLTVALIVWGSITLLAVPVLGRFGALADNPTLLDRSYQTSWWILSAVVAAAVVAASVLSGRRTQT